jgi:DNA-directed RNA polymerase specialized sigma subunit
MDKKSSSMDIKIGTGSNGKSISDLIKDPNSSDMYSDREKEKFMSSFMKKGMKALNDKEQFVIKAFYGLLDPKDEDKIKSSKGKVTNTTVGKYLGITNSGVLMIHRRALSKLKSALS